MLKLYKKEGDAISYWETWDKNAKTGLVHWGIIGDKGQSKEVASSLFKSFRKSVQSEINERIKDGYNAVDIEDHYTLLIEYAVDGMGTHDDVEKRTRLQDKMDAVLGWTGLGHCDGGSIGSGTMEVCCYVIDFAIAKRVIEEALVGTEFDNYTRIYDENDTDSD